MATDPSNPPVNSSPTFTIRPLGSNLPLVGVPSLTFAWVEGSTPGTFLPGLYASIPTTPAGDFQWTHVGGTSLSALTAVNGVSHIVTPGEEIISYIGVPLNTVVTVTLPTPSAAQVGRAIIVKDAVGACTATEIISVVTANASTIEGFASVMINNAFGMRGFLCSPTAGGLFAWVRLGST